MRLLARITAFILKLWFLTLRWQKEDPENFTQPPQKNTNSPVIWCCWHNSVLGMLGGSRRYIPWRTGSVLTSASHDGAFLAAVISYFRIDAVRGSSSRRGIAAFQELCQTIEAGNDVAITPDGPRGPRYHLASGIIKLAQKTQAPILPIQIKYSRAKILRTWDAMRLPFPFSKVTICFHPLVSIHSTLSPEELEQQRQQLEHFLLPSEFERNQEPTKPKKKA